MTPETKTMTGAEIVKTLACDYNVKSIRKNKDGDTKVTLDNKAELMVMVGTKEAKYLMQHSRAHQLKAMSAWQHRQTFLGFNKNLPSTEGALFVVKSYFFKVAILIERMIAREGFSPAEAVELGNQVLALKNQDWMFLMHIDSDSSFIREVAALQMRIGEI